jgi:hypothetical protein
MAYQVYESRNGSHWKHFYHKEEPKGAVQRFWYATRHIVTLPFALLTMLLVLALFPVLVLFDRVRGRE